ncbi:hypothetical protein LEMLEM_LOCUS27064 [Lemmus lemmus]
MFPKKRMGRRWLHAKMEGTGVEDPDESSQLPCLPSCCQASCHSDQGLTL